MDGQCKMCPAFLSSSESYVTGLCHGCRSGPPEQKLPAGAVVSRDSTTYAHDWWAERCVRCGVDAYDAPPPSCISDAEVSRRAAANREKRERDEYARLKRDRDRFEELHKKYGGQ